MQDIVKSLLWTDRWEEPVMSAAHTEIQLDGKSGLRRRGFPSWTWAGWRHVQGWTLDVNGSEVNRNPERLYLTSPITAPVPEGDAVRLRICYKYQHLSWPEDAEEVERRSHLTTEHPAIIVVSGPVLDASITCRHGEGPHCSSDPDKRRVWKYASPSVLADSIHYKYTGPPFSLAEVNGDTTLNLLACCIFSEFWSRSTFFSVHTLMLRQVDEDDDGPIYERVTCACFDSFSLSQGRDFSVENMNLRQMELRIR